MSLIDPESDMLLWGVVIGLVGIGFWAEQKTRIGKMLTGIIVAMSVTMVLSNLKIIPTAAPVYDSIFSNILPVAIPLLLFRADLRRILRDGGPALGAFLIGAVGIVLGVLLATALVPLGGVSAIAAGLFTATYTGGSANFAAVAVATDFNDGGTLTAMIAADVLVTNIQTMLLVALPGIALLRKFYGTNVAGVAAMDGAAHTPYRLDQLNLPGLCLAVALAYLLVAAGNFAAEFVGNSSYGVLFASAFALIVGNFFRPVVDRLSGDFEAGIFLVFLFLVALAAGADVWVLAETGPVYLIYASIILAVHTLFVVVVARFVKLDIRAVVIGSTACVGGVASASAIASAKGWRDLILPGIVVGTFGNAIGTFLGVWIWALLK